MPAEPLSERKTETRESSSFIHVYMGVHLALWPGIGRTQGYCGGVRYPEIIRTFLHWTSVSTNRGCFPATVVAAKTLV